MTDAQNKKMQDKTAILTGASGGIGSEIAKMLGTLGMLVVLSGRREEKLTQVKADVIAAGGQALVCPGDQSDISFAETLVRCAVDRFGGVDVLINAAGLAQNTAFEKETEEEFDRIMNINVKAPYFLVQKALPYLRKSDCATVINIGSVTSHHGYPFQSAYAASKHAIYGWSKAVANEHYQEDIRIHTICPGSVYTEMIGIARPDLHPEEMMQPSSIAGTIRFLLEMRHTAAVIDNIDLHRANKAPYM